MPYCPCCDSRLSPDPWPCPCLHERYWCRACKLCRLHCGYLERELVDVGEELDEDDAADEPVVVVATRRGA